MNRWPSAPPQSIDVDCGQAVLEFTYCYLEDHSRPPSDNEVRNVTATIARYRGCRFVARATLESLLADLYEAERE